MNLRILDTLTDWAFVGSTLVTAVILGCHTHTLSWIRFFRKKDAVWLRKHVSCAQLFWTDFTFRCARHILKPSVVMDMDLETERIIRSNPVLIISNHQRSLDISFIAWFLRRYGHKDLRWIIKKGIERWLFVGRSCRLSGCAFVHRDHAKPKQDFMIVRDCAISASREQASVAIFPEGTRFKNADPSSSYHHVHSPHPAGVAILYKHLPHHAVCSLTLCHEMRDHRRMLYVRVRTISRSEIGSDVRSWLAHEWECKEAFIAQKYL